MDGETGRTRPRSGVTIEQRCEWVRLGEDPAGAVLAFAGGCARAERDTVVVRCPFSGGEAVMRAGDALVRWPDGTFTVMSGRALARQVRETGLRGEQA